MALRFDGKVAIVTGAGGGLGREYARLLGRLGAKVVVNDLGVSTGGEGNNSRAADVVVSEIQGFGGQAVANYDSVEFGDKIIGTALKAFNRVDILINNAGILRDVSFQKMTEKDWDLIMTVHLKGAYSCTKAAWPVMQQQRYGRIINTASASGLYGNFGQVNYAAAKLALVGFTRSLALEGASRNIRVNAIAPLAGTRMTETILPKEIVDALKPEYVSPLVAFLAHEKCEETGGIFEVGAGWIAQLRWQRTAGHIFPPGFTLDDVHRDWRKIGDFSGEVSYPTSMQESMMMVTQRLDQMGGPNPSSSKPAQTSGGKPSGPVDRAERLFELLGAYLALDGGKNGEALKKKVKAVFQFEIKKPAGTPSAMWTIDLLNSPGVSKAPAKKATVAFTVDGDTFVNICLGKLNAQKAFIGGKMKLKGDMAAAMKFTPNLFPKIEENLLSVPTLQEAVQMYLAGKGTSTSPSVSGSTETSKAAVLKSYPVVQILTDYMKTAGPQLVAKVGRMYGFNISVDGNKNQVFPFTIDLKNGSGKFCEGTPSNPDAVFTMADSDFLKVMKGQLNPTVAFAQGKMKIKGNMAAATKFTPDLFKVDLTNI